VKFKDMAISLEKSTVPLSELDTQLEVAYMLGYIDEEKWKETFDEITDVFKMLSGLIRSVKQ
jgi:four helix bundle protein